MVIDLHTHVFPDKIAASALKVLKGNLKNDGKDDRNFTDGTKNSLISSMKKNGIDRSVVLPVVTSPGQFESINKFAAEINGKDGLISFGGIHPDNENPEEKLEIIKASGLKGIKLQPDYQGTFVNDEKYIRIINYALFLGFTISFHCGYDVVSPDIVHCSPERIEDMLEKVKLNLPKGNIVLAHLGSYGNLKCEGDFSGIDKYGVYYDTSFVLDRIPEDLLLKFIKDRGIDKILFATDSPWKDQGEYKKTAENLPFKDSETEKILWKNALNLNALNL